MQQKQDTVEVLGVVLQCELIVRSNWPMPNWHNTEAAAMTLIARGNQSCANKRRNLYALLCPPKGREGSGQIGKAEAEHDAVESDTLTADTGQEQTTLASLSRTR